VTKRPKASFDNFVDEQMRSPSFANAYVNARAKIDAVDRSKLPSADEMRKRVAKLEKDREDKRTLRGEHAPKSGTCRVCGGEVFANIAYPQSKTIGGPSLQAYVKDWNCENCGIVYKFPPKKTRAKR
jgi:hypothetical protein